MLDYGSEDINGMDDDAKEEHAQKSPLIGARQLPPRMTYTWWIHPKRTMATMKRIQSRISLLRYSQSTDISGAALNHVVKKTAIPARQTTTLRTRPKTKESPSS